MSLARTQSPLLKALIPVLKLAVAAGLIFWLIHSGKFNLKSLEIAFQPLMFLGFLALTAGALLVANWRWQILLSSQGFALKLQETLPLSFIGLFFNYAMPGSIGGDLIKGYYLVRDFTVSENRVASEGFDDLTPTIDPHRSRKFAAAMSVFMDRLIGFFVMVLSASLAITVFYERLRLDSRLLMIGVGTFFVTGVFLLVFVLGLSRRVQTPLRESMRRFRNWPGYQSLHSIYRAVHAYRNNTQNVILAILLSLLNQVILVALFALTAAALKIPVSISTLLFCVPVGLVAQAIPVAPAGVGVGQAAFAFLFATAESGTNEVGAVGITMLQGFQFLLGLLGAFFYLRKGRVENLSRNESL